MSNQTLECYKEASMTDNIIKSQFERNKSKNLFYGTVEDNLFESTDIPKKLYNKITSFTREEEQEFLGQIVQDSLNYFYRLNQYYSFDKQAKNELYDIYYKLLSAVKNQKVFTITGKTIKEHQNRLRQWLKTHNSFAEKLYGDSPKVLEPVPCAFYSPKFQIDLLRLNITEIKEPILDIGCGKNKSLVNYFLEKGIITYGIDREVENSYSSESVDWFEFDFNQRQWGTIVSNLAFSNHFLHHHLRTEGNYIKYAKAYMKILHSLKIGGCFHYSPSLPFIEKHLDLNHYSINYYYTGEYGFKVTIVKKLIN